MLASFAKFVKISSYKKKTPDILSKAKTKYYKQYYTYTILILYTNKKIILLKVPLRIQQNILNFSINW